MQGWQWTFYDPDGFCSAKSMTLAVVTNRLAFEGHSAPKQAILELLCGGKIAAHCSYIWKKYQGGDTFRLEGNFAPVSRTQWQMLSASLQEESRQIREGEWQSHRVCLEKLCISDVERVEWSPASDRFSYAIIPPETSVNDANYSEELFSAWDITLYPLLPPGTGLIEEEAKAPDSDDDLRNPPLSAAELNRWWASKANVREHLSKDELLALVRARYPDNHISRDTIRELAGPRKKGPKRI